MVTADEVRQIREELGCSIMEAKRIAKGRYLHRRLEIAYGMDGIKDVLSEILDELYPEPPRKKK